MKKFLILAFLLFCSFTISYSQSKSIFASEFLENNRSEYGLSDSDISEWVVTDEYTSRHNGITHLYIRQMYQGIEVLQANMNFNLTEEGQVLQAWNQFIPNLESKINTTTPSISAEAALSIAAESHDLLPTAFEVPFDHYLIFVPVESGVRLAWNINIKAKGPSKLVGHTSRCPIRRNIERI